MLLGRDILVPSFRNLAGDESSLLVLFCLAYCGIIKNPTNIWCLFLVPGIELLKSLESLE